MKSLVLRVCKSEGRSSHGFVWPLTVGAVVMAPDWRDTKECGNGLHGWLYGQGDHSCSSHWAEPGAVWLVLEVESASMIDLGGKVKFPECVVRFAGDMKSVADYLWEHEPRSRDVAVIGACRAEKQDGARVAVGALGTATAGNSGTATAGTLGTATAGTLGTATAGNFGTATAGNSGTATAGTLGTATAGDSGTATAGALGTATAGDSGTATAGNSGTATAGALGTATAGDSGTATAGALGTATAGALGTATAGTLGTATAGTLGTATAGTLGTATAGTLGTATAGNFGTATAGNFGTATAGALGTATAGDSGTATAGNSGTATAGNSGTATAGNRGTATAGNRGTATAGKFGVIAIEFYDQENNVYRMRIGTIGEDGLEPDVAYKLDANAKFVRRDTKGALSMSAVRKVLQPYRPGSGSEGAWFQEKFCVNCIKDHAVNRNWQDPDWGRGCQILARSLAHDVKDPLYPKEWVRVADGPFCTAYVPDLGQDPNQPNALELERAGQQRLFR
jgi:hypothetical protein